MKIYKKSNVGLKDDFPNIVRFAMTMGLLLFVIAFAKAQSDTTAFTYQKPLFDFDYIKPIFKLKDEQLSNKNKFLRFSVLTGYREGVKPIAAMMDANFMRSDDPSTGAAKLSMYNLSIVEMLCHFLIDNPNLVVLEVQDRSKYMYDPKYGDKEAWLRKNGHCFELTMPAGAISSKTLNSELTRVLKVKFGWEKRLVKTPDTGEMKEKEMFVVTELKESK